MAGVFTIFGYNDFRDIKEEEMQMGIVIAQWFLDESMGLQTEMGISQKHQKADQLLNWLKGLNQDDEEPLLLSEINQIGSRSIRSVKDRDEAIETLCRHGWVKKEKWNNRNSIVLHPSIRST